MAEKVANAVSGARELLKNIVGPSKLRDLITNIRGCKTGDEEREVVNKECADIRAWFRKEDNEYRGRNVAKLLYIHMLGYPAHFGQLECLKLVSSQKFSDKRIGYLGTMMLLDESKDIHILVTNSLKNDMNHQTQYVAGLSLCTLASICSAPMARDLAGEVEKLLKSSNSYVRKKAVLCALRIIRKVPDLMENFVPATRSLLGERNHGVLITGVTLIHEMCLIDPESLAHFRRMVPTLVRLLKNLITAGYSPEHDVGGVTDPFLQVQVLRLMRILGKGDIEASEAMNDVLAQVATNTESAKNVGNAILYEAVQCIMDIQADSGLRVLAVNILGKFLVNADRNIRYVALTTLLRIVQHSPSQLESVQRHRATIVECLQEPDSSIRRRALALIFALINEGNVRPLIREVLAFLEVADAEFKTYVCSETLRSAERFAPNKQWHIETILRVLTLGGTAVRIEDVTRIAGFFSSYVEMHALIAGKVYRALLKDISAQPLCQVGVWCIGELGDYLFAAPLEAEDEDNGPLTVTPTDALDLLQRIIEFPTSNRTTREYTLTAIMKLAARTPAEGERIRALVRKYANNVDEELQQRSAEYTTIFYGFEHIRPALFERMPAIVVKALEVPVVEERVVAPAATQAAAPASGAGDLLGLLDDPLGPTSTAAAPAAPAGGASLLDLLGGDLIGGSSSAPAAPAAPATMGGGLDDLLGGLLGGSTPAPVAPAPALHDPLADLMGGLMGGLMGSAPAPVAAAGGIPSIVAYEEDGIKLVFAFEKPAGNPNLLNINVTTTNASPALVTDYVFQAAVPTSFQLKLNGQSGNVLMPGNSGNVTQLVQILNPTQQPIRLRLRLSYSVNGAPVVKTAEVTNMPANAK